MQKPFSGWTPQNPSTSARTGLPIGGFVLLLDIVRIRVHLRPDVTGVCIPLEGVRA